MEEVIVKVENLSHRYSVHWAVRDINFEILKNGIYGLLGSNGAGKSTTMNIMCGVLKPTHGEIFIKGISLRENPVKARMHNGFLPQKPPLQSELTVKEFLVYCANLRKIPPKEISRAVLEVMGQCKLEHFQNRLIRNLSGGYQQRVGIAQAIIHKPELVVLDEPTNGLDPNQIVEIRHLIKEIAQDRTVLLSTHILSEVQVVCDYIRMIEHGHVVFSGTVEEFNNTVASDSLCASFAGSVHDADLQLIPGIRKVEIVDGNKFRIHFTDKDVAIRQIVETSVAKNWELREIYIEKISMDTVFAELSRNNNN